MLYVYICWYIERSKQDNIFDLIHYIVYIVMIMPYLRIFVCRKKSEREKKNEHLFNLT